jgi:hypothetical protein
MVMLLLHSAKNTSESHWILQYHLVVYSAVGLVLHS